jgi:hypothetical protein
MVAAAALVLAACATTTPGQDPGPGGGSNDPVAPVDVVGQGTVIQVGDATPELCLGAVAESFPPQCSGVPLLEWDWNLYDGSETAAGTTWGTYAVFGSWENAKLVVTDAIQLALYDPMVVEDPQLDPANAGTSTEDELLAIQEGIADAAPVEVLMTFPQNGYLFVTVIYDDGTVQAWADATYGAGVVAVRSALVSLSAG